MINSITSYSDMPANSKVKKHYPKPQIDQFQSHPVQEKHGAHIVAKFCICYLWLLASGSIALVTSSDADALVTAC